MEKFIILDADKVKKVGWVQVDPFDYEFTGDDPNGVIVDYLDSIDSGNYQFDWSAELIPDGYDENELPAKKKIATIAGIIQSRGNYQCILEQ